jgi:quinoprotein dehydrogenase-associated probable ABC transporter substrate-binding protein
MSSRCRDLALIAFVFALLGAEAGATDKKTLRVCADPDNLPFSHQDGSGFENRLAQLLAKELDADLSYSWMPQRRGFVRKTIGEGACELWMGVPAGFERVATTRPYYRSSYVFVYRDEATGFVRSFDDPQLASTRFGVQLVGNDLAATPPGHALAQRGAVRNVTGFTVYGTHPAAERMIDALDARTIDTALIWGPQAGYFASRAKTKLVLALARPPAELKEVPFEFSIAVGVKRSERALLSELDRALEKRRAEIDALLAEYRVPRTDVRLQVQQ